MDNFYFQKAFLFILFSIVFLFPINCLASNSEPVSAKGVVSGIDTITKPTEEIDSMIDSNIHHDYYEEQNLKVKILSNQDKGKTVNIVNDIRHNPFDIKVKKGDKVFLYGYDNNGEIQYSIRDFWHLDSLIFWTIIFFALIIVIGKKQGFKSLFTLVISLLIIFAVYIPLVQKGSSPIQVSILISIAVSCLSLPIIYGFSKKAFVSMIGTIGGITTASLFSFVIICFSHFNGLGTEDMRLFAFNNPDMNFQGIFFSGIIIGALGAIMDVSVSISSGLQEIIEHNPKIHFKKLIVSGMSIGKDIMGSMLNTLIFAYVGTSIATILIISQNDIGIMEFLNYDYIAEEIIRSIVGSIGLLTVIPITAITAGIMHKPKLKKIK